MDSADRPREIIIHQSANRPNQLMGGDRELVLVSLLTSVALAFSLASWWGLAVSVAWYVGAMAVLKRMGKADPLLRQVYMRHIRYRPFYPAKSGLYSRCLQPPMTWR
jgi:type IV secretion system protein VirB3